MTSKPQRNRLGCLAIVGTIACFCLASAAVGAWLVNARYEAPGDVAEIAERRLPELRAIARRAGHACPAARGHDFLNGPPSPLLDTEAARWPELHEVMIACYGPDEGMEGEFARYGDEPLFHFDDDYQVVTLEGPLFEYHDYMGPFSSPYHDWYALKVPVPDGDFFVLELEEPIEDGGHVRLRAVLRRSSAR